MEIRSAAQPQIELRDVFKSYKTGAGDVTVLKDVSLQVLQGDFVSIIGPSGSGKSTMLNMITGIDHPTRGEVVIGGQTVHQLSENRLARWRGKNIGVIFQFFQLLPTLTILENVMLPMDFCGVYKWRDRKRRALKLLEQVEIADQAHKLPGALSGGQQQRAAIARALANDPPIIVGDEPTGNLDSKTANAIFGMFLDLVEEGKTVVIVTHDAALSERTGRVIHIRDGRVDSDSSVKREA